MMACYALREIYVINKSSNLPKPTVKSSPAAPRMSFHHQLVWLQSARSSDDVQQGNGCLDNQHSVASWLSVPRCQLQYHLQLAAHQPRFSLTGTTLQNSKNNVCYHGLPDSSPAKSAKWQKLNSGSRPSIFSFGLCCCLSHLVWSCARTEWALASSVPPCWCGKTALRLPGQNQHELHCEQWWIGWHHREESAIHLRRLHLTCSFW